MMEGVVPRLVGPFSGASSTVAVHVNRYMDQVAVVNIDEYKDR